MSMLSPSEIMITYKDGSVRHYALKFGDKVRVREVNTTLRNDPNPIHYLTVEIVPNKIAGSSND